MKILRTTSQYKKDLKRYQHDTTRLEALVKVLDMLKNEIPLPANYQPHPLKGRYKGYLECHIGGDFLLIWFDPNSDTIFLHRLGSHSELFGL